MRIRLPYIALGFFVLSALASAAALANMDSIPALILIAPGYVVQAWLFQSHLALGGMGYQATMIGVSALFWTVIFLGAAGVVRYLVRRIRGQRAA